MGQGGAVAERGLEFHRSKNQVIGCWIGWSVIAVKRRGRKGVVLQQS